MHTCMYLLVNWEDCQNVETNIPFKVMVLES